MDALIYGSMIYRCSLHLNFYYYIYNNLGLNTAVTANRADAVIKLA